MCCKYTQQNQTDKCAANIHNTTSAASSTENNGSGTQTSDESGWHALVVPCFVTFEVTEVSHSSVALENDQMMRKWCHGMSKGLSNGKMVFGKQTILYMSCVQVCKNLCQQA